MGFKFNPAGTFTLAASVLRNNGQQAIADLDEALQEFTGTDPTTNGPRMTISSFGGQLKYIKVGFVITVIQDNSNYPTTNTAPFLYSGVYMNYTLFNVAKPIVTVVDQENIRFITMLQAKYQIYGLSSFSLSSLPSSISVIDINVELPDLNTALIQTDNTNHLSFVRFSADYWNNIIDNTCNSTSAKMENVQQKLLTTVPVIERDRQTII